MRGTRRMAIGDLRLMRQVDRPGWVSEGDRTRRVLLPYERQDQRRKSGARLAEAHVPLLILVAGFQFSVFSMPIQMLVKQDL